MRRLRADSMLVFRTKLASSPPLSTVAVLCLPCKSTQSGNAAPSPEHNAERSVVLVTAVRSAQTRPAGATSLRAFRAEMIVDTVEKSEPRRRARRRGRAHAACPIRPRSPMWDGS